MERTDPASPATEVEQHLSDLLANHNRLRAIFGQPPIPDDYDGPLRRKWRDRDAIAARLRASRAGVEL